MLVQVVIQSKGRSERRLIDVATGVLTIGRAPTCTLPIESVLISRTHVSVDVNGQRMRVTDSSTNGTLAGDRVVRGSSTEVAFGVPIVLGEHTVWIEAPDPSVAKTIESASEKAQKPTVPAPLPTPARASSRPVATPKRAVESTGDGPLQPLMADPSVDVITVIDPDTIYVERAGRRVRADAAFTDEAQVRAVIDRMAPSAGRADASTPLVDTRVDGWRVTSVARPFARRGSTVVIRRVARASPTVDELIAGGTMTGQVGTFLARCVAARKNVVIAGGPGSGKTALLNGLAGAIPFDERIVLVEESAELELPQPCVVSLEARPADAPEGCALRDLLESALRMRPDRVVVGECRGSEALTLLRAMSAGHEGSLTTMHATSPRDMVSRLEALLRGDGALSAAAARELVAGLHLVVQLSRAPDGARKVVSVAEIAGVDPSGEIALVPLFAIEAPGAGPGELRATGFLPTFLDEFVALGLVKPGEAYL